MATGYASDYTPTMRGGPARAPVARARMVPQQPAPAGKGSTPYQRSIPGSGQPLDAPLSQKPVAQPPAAAPSGMSHHVGRGSNGYQMSIPGSGQPLDAPLWQKPTSTPIAQGGEGMPVVAPGGPPRPAQMDEHAPGAVRGGPAASRPYPVRQLPPQQPQQQAMSFDAANLVRLPMAAQGGMPQNMAAAQGGNPGSPVAPGLPGQGARGPAADPQSGSAPRYTPEQLQQAQLAVSQRRPDGSFAYKGAERRGAQHMIDAATHQTWRNTPAGSTGAQGANPYNPNAPRYEGIDDQDMAWANEAVTARRPDGSYVYKESERNHAQKQIIDRARSQDRDLADPMSGASLRGRFGAFMDNAGSRANSAYDRMLAADDGIGEADSEWGASIDGLEGWNPDEQDGFDTSFLRDLSPDAMRSWSPDRIGNFDSTATRGWSPTAMAGVSTEGLRSFDAGGAMEGYLARNGGGGGWDTNASGATSNYDPRAAMEEYARGAAALAKTTLADSLEDADNAAVRNGRLRTGLLDRDKGRVITRVGEDLNSQILTKALDAAGIRAGIEQSNTRNLTDASIASARERGNMGSQLASLRSSEARDAANLGYKALSDATGYDADLAAKTDSLRLDAASNIDKNALTAAEATDRMTLDQASGIDDFRLKGAQGYADTELKRRSGMDDARLRAREGAVNARGDRTRARTDRADLAQRLYGDERDVFGDALSGERDRVTARENFDRIMREGSKDQKNAMINGIINGGTQLLAKIFGG